MKLLLLFIFIFLNLINSFAQEISVITEDWPPYNYKENSQVVGISTEIVEETLKKAGVEYNIEIYPWARAYHMALNHKNTLIYTIVRNKEREKLFYWIGPFASRNISLYKLKERKDIVINKLDDARKYVIGLVRNDAMHIFFKKRGFTNINLVNLEEQNMKMLFAKRIDLITGNHLSLSYKINKLGYKFDKLDKILTLVDSDGYYMAINKSTDKRLVDKIRKSFEQIKKEGIVDEIINKYLSTVSVY